ncbi:hypothetical protein [Salinicoccus roseus]|uniref:hypothetical protein n=1 Tax=Salinicoccus roseus TaxID=45670 RepID=UPI002301056A|nr:hypothetical protein [Salinicoccus roseus]
MPETVQYSHRCNGTCEERIEQQAETIRRLQAENAYLRRQDKKRKKIANRSDANWPGRIEVSD